MSEAGNDTQKAPTLLLIGLAGWTLMFMAYTLLFWIVGTSDLVGALKRATFNTLPAMLLAWPVVRIVERSLIDASLWRQALAHFGLALGYSLLWYIGLQVAYGLQNGIPVGGIVGRALAGPALPWQMFQGVTLYAVVALYAYASHYKLRLDALKNAPQPATTASTGETARQLFLKDGRTIRPTALEDVLLLSGAGDYTEVATKDGTYLSSTSLNAFEEELPRASFLRVHRSHIVRTDAVMSVESGGNGRLILHLPKGVSVTTSRAGAKAVRELAL